MNSARSLAEPVAEAAVFDHQAATLAADVNLSPALLRLLARFDHCGLWALRTTAAPEGPVS